jgi:uncharacterized protein
LKRHILIAIPILILLFIGKAYYDTNTIEIRHFTIKNSPLGVVLNGLKVAHLSDLHIKEMGLREKKILDILKKEKPDLILFTGDYIKFDGPYEPVMEFFKELQAPLGVYAVMGNTDYYNENASCVLCHKEKSREIRKSPPFFLRNSSAIMNIKGNLLTIAGVDDPVNKKSDLSETLRGVKPEQPCILLSHSPEIFEEASSKGVDLVLSGHTHGGQIIGVKLLQRLFPLDPALETIEGFFQKGKTLMYVTRGIGTSFLPFRLGVKPEVSFFTFEESRKGENSANDFKISNGAPMIEFAGINMNSFLETFNFINYFKKYSNSSNVLNSKILFDFESEEELRNFNWECHKWFELSSENTTSGKHSLKVSLPPGQYPGINFKNFRCDWSGNKELKLDVFNPSQENIQFHIRINDHKSGWEYADRYDKTFTLAQGMNDLNISLDTLKTNLNPRPINLKKIERMMVFIPDNKKLRELYIDNIRLE